MIGEVDARQLLATPERHVRCNPTQAQFVVDERFEPVTVDGPFDKRKLDGVYVSERERLVTAGWRRLQEVQSLGIPVSEYPLKSLHNR